MKLKTRISAFVFSLFFILSTLSGCASNGEKEPATKAESIYEYFDTLSVIFSYRGDTESEFKANCDAIRTLLKEYHQLFDIYYEYAGINNVKTVNKNAGVAPVKVDGRLIDFLLYCKELYTVTGGETNVAMGAVLKLWHDAREKAESSPQNAYVPSEQQLSEAALHTDIEKLIIDKEAGTVYLSDPEMSLDVGAIAKGYAVEKAAELLISRGVTSYVLNFGGNIRAIGTKVSGKGWVTGITNPDKTSDESFVCKVDLKDVSLVTSGDYERFYTVNGENYHHIIDKDTLMPSKHFSSVSVFTKNSALADALSTALFCMSYDEGLALINSIGGIDVIWVLPDGSVKMTDGVTVVKK